jgi:hypothetical protein
MNMDKTINNNIENLQSNFDMLWKEFTILFPIANDVIKNKELSKFRNSFIQKYKGICDSNTNIITSSCLLERFICTFNSAQQAVNFKSEVACIASAIDKALRLSSTDKTLNNKIKDIVKNMIITYDANPSSENNDYRNRLNEILIYNWLSECENIKVSFIEKDLGNGKKCDFVCQHIDDGSILLFDVKSINNLKIEKQDDSKTFSDFINQKVKEKFEEKTQDISTLPNLKIIPILEYTEGLESFRITVDNEIATPPLTVVKNTIDGVDNISLSTLEEISNHICHQRIAK